MRRPHGLRAVAVAALLVGAVPAAAQQRDTVRARAGVTAAGFQSSAPGTPNYDVVLEVPELSVDSIRLTVDGLRAHLALDARVANLVMLTAGADVTIEQVELEIDGVVAEAYAYVDLDNVARVVDRALTTLEENPEIVNSLLTTVDSAVGTVGGVADQALRPGGTVDRAVGAVGSTLGNVTAPNGLLSSTVDAVGRTVQRAVETGGRIVERTLDASGGLLDSRTVGSVTDLPVVRETAGEAGRVVKQVRDESGRLIEFTQDAAGTVTGARVLDRSRR